MSTTIKKRQSERIIKLATKASKEREKDGTNGEQQNHSGNPIVPRKRKRSPEKTDAGVKKERQNEKTQWMHYLLEPTVRRLIGNPNATHQKRCLHHAILQLPLQPNVLHEENLFSHFEITTPWTVHLPIPLYCPSAGLGPTTPDLMVRFLLVKDNYHRELNIVHRAYKRIKPRHSFADPDLRAVEEGDTIQNSAAVVYAALLDRDPDPYLLPEYGYDYHFTGGSMATIGAQEGSGILATVFTAVGESLERLEVIQLVPSKERGDEIEPGHVANCSLTGTSGPVLEITADIGGRWVLVRKRHTILALREVPSEAQSVEETGSTSASDTEWRAVGRIFSCVPFASVCIVMPGSLVKRKLTVCTVDYRRRLRLWEIDGRADVKRKGDHKLPKMQTSLHTEGNSDGDKWSSVRCIDGRSLIGCLDRHRIHLFSVRADGDESGESDESGPEREVESHLRLELRGSSSISQWTMTCERPCALEVAPAEGLIFIATCHKLLIATVDSDPDRSPTTTLGINVLLVFSHYLQQKPVFISHQRGQWGDRKDESEQHFLLFGSHLAMSYGVCSFEKSTVAESSRSAGPARPKYHSRHLPLHPPTFHDAYRLARARGFCLSADQPLRQRFTMACQSGMALIPTGGNGEAAGLHILLQTSGGDLLQQKVSTRGPTEAGNRRESVELERARAEQTKVAETLHRWHERLRQANGNPKPYSASNFWTMKKFRDIFNLPEDDPSELKEWFARATANTRGRGRPSKFTPSARNTAASGRRERSKEANPPPWRQTIEELQQYKDILAPAMLAVWGYGTDGAAAFTAPSAREQIATKLPSYQDVNERVDSWVATAVSSDPAGLPEPLLEPWQEQQPSQEHEPVPLSSQLNNTVYDDPVLNVLSQASTIPPPSQAFERPAERQTPARQTPAKKKYVKGF